MGRLSVKDAAVVAAATLAEVIHISSLDLLLHRNIWHIERAGGRNQAYNPEATLIVKNF